MPACRMPRPCGIHTFWRCTFWLSWPVDRAFAFDGQHRRRSAAAAVRVRLAAAVAVGLGALGGAALRRGCVADAKGLRMGRGHRARAAPPGLAARTTGVPALELTTSS